jgi:amidase
MLYNQHDMVKRFRATARYPDHETATDTPTTDVAPMTQRSPVDPCWLTARELARRIAGGELTAAWVLEAQLARIRARNPALGAVVSLDVTAAQAQAAAADAAVARGDACGPLHGVPITLKDGIDVAGLRTTLGTEVFDRIADADSTVAARLRAAGAILIGHTNVPPFLADYQSANPIFGRTSNPWNLARTAGGSGGGAAAAVAAGLSSLELGSDLGGSLRLPAHFCGVYGLKPTEHRVPMTGFFRLPPGAPRSVRILASLGPMARDLDDLELALALVAGPDGEDTEVPPVPLAAEPVAPLAGLRLACATTLPGAVVSSALAQTVERVATLAANAGARVEHRLPDCDWDAANALVRELISAVVSGDGEHALGWYFAALTRRDRFIALWDQFFADFDALLLPPAMTTAFAHCEPGTPLGVDGHTADYLGHGALLAMANLAGLPALVAPAGRDRDGLPIGVQLVGRAWTDLRLLNIARALEAAQILPGFQPPPDATDGATAS